MHKYCRRIALHTVLILAFLALASAGCNEEPPPSAFDPDYISPRPQPVITLISPPAALANVTQLTITGDHFDPNPDNNLVFFDNVHVPVQSATATELHLKAPDLPKDSISVKIGVYKAYLYSEPYLFRLGLAALEIGNLQPTEFPVAVEADTGGNTYLSVAGVPVSTSGVFKITPSGSRSLYSPLFSPTVATWRGMKFGWGGVLYCVAARNIIFQIPPGGGAPSIWLSGNATNGLTDLYDLDFDPKGNIWAAGPTTGVSQANHVFRITQDKSVLSFPFSGLIRTIRVFDGYLYVGGARDGLQKVWRLPIVSADSLGAEEEYVNFSSIVSRGTVTAITFDTDGDMYVGTDIAEGIVVIHPDRSHEPLYPGVVYPATAALTWGSGTDLFQSRTSNVANTPSALVKINSLKAGAPYFGRRLP